MEDLRIGGIVSGMDTNSIVDTLVKRARSSIDRMQGEYEIKNLEKSMYQDFSSKLTTIKTDLLSLKLESTFKSKNVSSSNSSILTATASTGAAVGNHSITVDQTASKSFAKSQFLRSSVYRTGAGVTGISGRPESFLEGTHETSVSQQTINSTNYYTAQDEFTPKNLGSFQQKTGNSDVSIVNDDGSLNTDITSEQFSITVDSTTISTTVSASSGDDINTVGQKIQSGLNEGLNSHFSTTNTQYITASSKVDTGTGEWSFSLNKTTLESFDFSVDDTTLSRNLGFFNTSGTSTVTSSSVTSIQKSFVASDQSALLTKLNSADGGLVTGSTLSTEDTGLTEGTFSVAQDASLNVSAGTPTTIYGNTVSSGGGLDTSVEGLQNAGFLNAPSDDTNGSFSINGTNITIEDYTSISADELIGKINSSGAGVSASYNSAEDRIELEANEDGSKEISLGSIDDTSNALSVLRLSAQEGATVDLGTTEGSIDPTTTLNEAGFTSGVSSGVFTINDVSIYVDPTKDSLNDVFYKVNNSGAGVTMSYDESSDKVTVRSDDVSKISFGSSSDTSNFLQAVNMTDDTTTAKELGNEGRYAVLNVDGVNYVRKNNEIDDIIDGVTFNINNSSTENVNLNVSVDTTKAVDSVAKFVQHYNTMIEKLSPPEVEDQDEKYLEPLTESDKASMSDSEIEQYQENFIKYNEHRTINRSSELRSLKNTLRSNLLTQVPGVKGDYNTLSDLGLDIAGDGNIEIEKKGMLVVDSTDLEEIKESLNNNTEFKSALSSNPDDVYNLFAQDTESGRGWARLYEEKINVYNGTNGVLTNKVKPYGSLDRSMSRLLQQIEDTQDRVDSKLDRLWKEFSTMEEKIAQIQSQGDYMTKMLQSQ